MTLAERASELERVAKEAADLLRAQSAPAMTVYELAEALRYNVDDDESEEQSLEDARGIFERVAEIRSGKAQPYSYEREIAEGK